MKGTLLEILLGLCEYNAISGWKECMPAGHNGPYQDPETPVRNSAHWLITCAKAYEWTGAQRFKAKVRALADYLCSEEARPYGFSFHHRDKEGKDRCNGLIGQAWTIEALAEASRLLGDETYARLAEEVFFQHPFNKNLGLWRRLEVDGRALPYDAAFNHQLWFAACASMIRGTRQTEIIKRVTAFIDAINANLTVFPNGLVYHTIERVLKPPLRRRLKDPIYKWLGRGKYRKGAEAGSQRQGKDREGAQDGMVYKSIGYHAFNMYGFALLRNQIPNHDIWASDPFRRMVRYLRSEEWRKAVSDNKYGYPYNPLGYEVPYSLYVLDDVKKDELIGITSQWANEQFSRCFDRETGKMSRNTEDAETHTARLYEVMRLPQDVLAEVKIEIA